MSKYGTRTKLNSNYPIGSTMTVLYDPRNYDDERAEMLTENKKGMIVSGILSALVSLASGIYVVFVYREARQEIESEERLYPPGYDIYVDANTTISTNTNDNINNDSSRGEQEPSGVLVMV